MTQGHLSNVVVIPACGEPELWNTLWALHNCPLPTDISMEVLVLLNEHPETPAEQKQLNHQTYEQWPQLKEKLERPTLRFHCLYLKQIPPKIAGVGFARRQAMDWASKRLFEAGNPQGLIINLDADCTCENNYLTELWQYFIAKPTLLGCSIYFEHPLDGPLEPLLYQGIQHYELFLRYYRFGLLWAESPYAHHTVGSCFAVRASAYHKVGGMNNRQAGEDFYFIQKLIQQGEFGYLTGTTVYPSARISERVPFGTGAAQKKWLNSQNSEYLTYTVKSFSDLKKLHQSLPLLFETPLERISQEWFPHLPSALQEYLEKLNWQRHIEELKNNSRQFTSFRKRFIQWFNHLKTLQYLHFCRDKSYGSVPLTDALAELGHYLQWELPSSQETLDWLFYLRQQEKAQR